jgi:hypothetical protein
MMYGGGSSEIGGIGPGDQFSYTMGICALLDHGGRCCPMATMRPYSQHQSTQQSANATGLYHQNKVKLLLIMFISYSKAGCIDKLLCLFIAGRDGCTADAEHWWQQ